MMDEKEAKKAVADYMQRVSLIIYLIKVYSKIDLIHCKM
jgi:hypothetical protein